MINLHPFAQQPPITIARNARKAVSSQCVNRSVHFLLNFYADMNEAATNRYGHADPMQSKRTHRYASASYRLAEAPGYRITYHRPLPDVAVPDKRLIITFGTLQAGLANAGFGTDVCLRHGHPTIYVAPRKGSWYQELSLDAFANAVTPLIGNKRPAVYGTSLGGYASVYFGGSIDADIIAAAPRCLAMPELQMNHAQTVPMRHEPLTDAPRTTGKVAVFWDPHERPDSILVNNFIRKKYPDAEYQEFPYAGHTVLKTMAKIGKIREFILPLLYDTTMAKLELPKESNPIWHYNHARGLMHQGLVDDALTQADLSFALQPSPENILLLVRIFTHKQMHDRASILQTLIDTDPAISRMAYGRTRKDLANLLGLPAPPPLPRQNCLPTHRPRSVG